MYLYLSYPRDVWEHWELVGIALALIVLLNVIVELAFTWNTNLNRLVCYGKVYRIVMVICT